MAVSADSRRTSNRFYRVVGKMPSRLQTKQSHGCLSDCRLQIAMWESLKKYHERPSLSSKLHVNMEALLTAITGRRKYVRSAETVLTNRLTAMGKELKKRIIVAMLL